MNPPAPTSHASFAALLQTALMSGVAKHHPFEEQVPSPIALPPKPPMPPSLPVPVPDPFPVVDPLVPPSLPVLALDTLVPSLVGPPSLAPVPEPEPPVLAAPVLGGELPVSPLVFVVPVLPVAAVEVPPTALPPIAAVDIVPLPPELAETVVESWGVGALVEPHPGATNKNDKTIVHHRVAFTKRDELGITMYRED